jgi:hypothetical protein
MHFDGRYLTKAIWKVSTIFLYLLISKLPLSVVILTILFLLQEHVFNLRQEMLHRVVKMPAGEPWDRAVVCF